MPSTSKSQQRLMGVAYAVKKGDMKISSVDSEYREAVADLVDGMSLKSLKDFAETKHKGLPERVKENLVPGDIPGMGPVTLPGNPGALTDFSSQKAGSGDVPFLILAPAKKKKKKKFKYLHTFESYSFVNEGKNDPGILKAFFMAGGPGSGKSTVATELFAFPKGSISSVSYDTGLKLVNSDNAYEKMLTDAGFDVGLLADYAKDISVWPEIMAIRDKAKGLTKRFQDNYICGRLGMVIDGTGKDYNKIKGHRQLMIDFGYDTYMVFVNTSLETSIARNKMRKRVLPDDLVEKMWKEVQQNIGKFQNLFGIDSIIIVDNNGNDDQLIKDVEKEIRKKLNSPVKNPKGKRWLKTPTNPSDPCGFNM